VGPASVSGKTRVGETLQDVIESDGLHLVAHLALPDPDVRDEGPVPGLVLCHGFPVGGMGAASTGLTYPQLADRIAEEAGWAVLTFNFRGSGGSGGDFSLGGWLADLRAAVDHLCDRPDVHGVWLCGASTGGSLAVCLASEDERVRGVAALAARADFDDWAAHPKRLLDHARQIGLIRHRDFPSDPEAWARELREVRPLALAAKLAPRPLLVVHGAEDEVVPVVDARALVDCHGHAELRVLKGAGHQLRHDPRAVAVLLGWLERQAGAG
jgi:uncharacterized protein